MSFQARVEKPGRAAELPLEEEPVPAQGATTAEAARSCRRFHGPLAGGCPSARDAGEEAQAAPATHVTAEAPTALNTGVERRPQGFPEGRAGRSGQVTRDLGSKCFLVFRLSGGLCWGGGEGLGRLSMSGWRAGIERGQSETPAPAESDTLGHWRRENLTWEGPRCL